jgi:hypothetical protein
MFESYWGETWWFGQRLTSMHELNIDKLTLKEIRIPQLVWPHWWKSYADEWERFMDWQSVEGTVETALGNVGNVRKKK